MKYKPNSQVRIKSNVPKYGNKTGKLLRYVDSSHVAILIDGQELLFKESELK